jgi:hypothetical protein
MYTQNLDYEILTPSGFKDFDGIKVSEKETIRLCFTDGSYLICTPTHQLKQGSVWVNAKSIKPNSKLNNKKVVSVSLDKIKMVFDPVNVSGDHSYISGGVTSHNCTFHGSSKTLISGEKMATVPFFEPKFIKGGLKMYEEPQKGHSYACTVDTSRGQHLDFSAFVIFDITTTPYRVAATFKDNTIGLTTYPFMIINTVKQYNDAYCLIEINDAGQEIANTIFYEFEYANVYFTVKENVTEGNGYPGVRTTKRVKSIGCSVLKELVEGEMLFLNSFDIIQELNVFEQKGVSYQASDTNINDDLTTCLWLFGWLSKQSMFADITNVNIRHLLAQKNEAYIMENMTPFGLVSDGLEDATVDFNAMHSGGGRDPLTNWAMSDANYD